MKISNTAHTAIDAYNTGAAVENLVKVNPHNLKQNLEAGTPAALADAMLQVLLVTEQLSQWVSHLRDLARDITEEDRFDWGTLGNDGWLRYRAIDRIAAAIDTYNVQ